MNCVFREIRYVGRYRVERAQFVGGKYVFSVEVRTTGWATSWKAHGQGGRAIADALESELLAEARQVVERVRK